MDIMLVSHLLFEHPYTVGSIQACNTWKALTVFLSKIQDPDGMLRVDVWAIDEKVTKKSNVSA